MSLIEKLADDEWPKMMQEIQKDNADIAFNVFLNALKTSFFIGQNTPIEEVKK